MSQQLDSGAFADDTRQHRWLEPGRVHPGAHLVADEPARHPRRSPNLEPRPGEGVRIRLVERDTGCRRRTTCGSCTTCSRAPEDHFNSHEETFDEFVFRLRGEYWTAGTTGGSPSSSTVAAERRSKMKSGPGGRGRRARRQLRRLPRCARQPPAAAVSPSRCWPGSSPTPPPGGGGHVGLEVDAE